MERSFSLDDFRKKNGTPSGVFLISRFLRNARNITVPLLLFHTITLLFGEICDCSGGKFNGAALSTGKCFKVSRKENWRFRSK